MSELRIDHEVTKHDVLKRAGHRKMAFYGANMMWWTANEDDLYKKPGIGLPCDPRGGMLFQTGEGDLDKFLTSAEENTEYYGKHGLRAFYASYRGVVVTKDGKPTCLDSWGAYNDLIDEYDAVKEAQ